ncbi:MAG: Arc family DNA-binding protein [Pseudomonas sp.]|uniref:Arc family DNA-binding protein n=1 Tax=Pseudomonas sp. TaxID=306 RepID=UPI0027338E78|nr:Arc family DNA-binding protein [Pseudomonas sp.]MDP3848645.1 Arc family DNA-binding protein [Pseudomonas sp.]
MHNPKVEALMRDRHAVSPYPLRMPDDLRAALDAAANKGGRSLHAEIVARLERTLQEDSQSLSDDLLEAIRLQANLTLALAAGLDSGLLDADRRQALDALASVSRRVAERLGDSASSAAGELAAPL